MNELIEKNTSPIAYRILELEEEKERIEIEIKEQKKLIMETMKKHKIKSIKTSYATVTLAERKNTSIDEDNVWEFLDAQGLSDDFRKLDKSKFMKMWPSHELITENKPTEYLTIKKGK